MPGLKNLVIVSNLSESAKIDGTKCAIRVTTSESSTITIERSIDNTNFSAIPDLSLTVDGSDELNLIDIVPGQFLRVRSSAEMTECKILS